MRQITIEIDDRQEEKLWKMMGEFNLSMNDAIKIIFNLGQMTEGREYLIQKMCNDLRGSPLGSFIIT